MSNATHALGKLFLHATWIILLVALSLYFNQLLERKNNPNQKPESFSTSNTVAVVLKRNPQNHYLATGSINSKAVVFIVDTGATYVSLSNNLAERLGLKRGSQGIAYTANGETVVYATQLRELRIGDIVLNNVNASITMGMADDEVLLGMSALKDLELTHKQGQLTLRQTLDR